MERRRHWTGRVPCRARVSGDARRCRIRRSEREHPEVRLAVGPLEALSFEDFQNVYATNTIAAYQMIRATRSLLEAGAKSSGKASAVVNVSSIAGLSGIGSSVAYVASKGALNSMTLSLARALAPSIRVNAICPGYMDTLWFEKGFGTATAGRIREHVRANMPLKLAPTGDDVAELVCFLASSRSGTMTGELVRMDAGLHLVSVPRGE
jgi:3-oxoacyl-[acyl-carrier protein] reductase